MKLSCLIIAAVFLTLGFPAQAELVSGMSVVVSDQVITSGEIAEEITPLIETAASIYAADRARFEDEARRVRTQQVESLVERKLVLHAFTSSGYVTNILESFIDDLVKKHIRDNFGGDRARFIQTLHAQGRTFEMYRRKTREDFIVNYMSFQNVDGPKKTLISPLKIEEYYKTHQDTFKVPDQVKVRMIVISQGPDDAPGQAKRIAGEILSKINSGVPFVEMAQIYQSGSQTSTNGGERGWVDRTYFKPELAEAAFSLKAGQHSGVIDLQEASYILLVEDTHPAHISSLSDVRGDIERTLKAQEKSRLRRQWIDRLKNKSFIEYY
jgi:parvulin-like peptidyl-prolyl isomerase